MAPAQEHLFAIVECRKKKKCVAAQNALLFPTSYHSRPTLDAATVVMTRV